MSFVYRFTHTHTYINTHVREYPSEYYYSQFSLPHISLVCFSVFHIYVYMYNVLYDGCCFRISELLDVFQCDGSISLRRLAIRRNVSISLKYTRSYHPNIYYISIQTVRGSYLFFNFI